jgi:hypothetical protein
MSAFPGAGARIFTNDAGEVVGWDYPSDPDPADRYDDRDDGPEVEPFECKCGEEIWPDDTEAIIAHYEVCTEPAHFWQHFGDELRDNDVERQH